MYTIINKNTNEVHNFTKVKAAAVYLKSLKGDKTLLKKDETIDLCNLFAKHKNKFCISY